MLNQHVKLCKILKSTQAARPFLSVQAGGLDPLGVHVMWEN